MLHKKITPIFSFPGEKLTLPILVSKIGRIDFASIFTPLSDDIPCDSEATLLEPGVKVLDCLTVRIKGFENYNPSKVRLNKL